MLELKRIYLCLAHMSEEGVEQKYINRRQTECNEACLNNRAVANCTNCIKEAME